MNVDRQSKIDADQNAKTCVLLERIRDARTNNNSACVDCEMIRPRRASIYTLVNSFLSHPWMKDTVLSVQRNCNSVIDSSIQEIFRKVIKIIKIKSGRDVFKADRGVIALVSLFCLYDSDEDDSDSDEEQDDEDGEEEDDEDDEDEE